MSDILPEVAAGFRDFTARFEGVVPYMYQDVKGLVTCGIGNLIDPMPAALPLPWLRPDGSRATRSEIVAEWRRVKAMPRALVYTRYHAPSGLHLDDDAIDGLVSTRLEADAAILVRYYPYFATFPAPAQTAILSMAWAMGAGFPKTWPRFSESVRAMDWLACAGTCAINSHGNVGVIPRNSANAALFREAAGSA